jgi:hypothetical protein
MENKSVERPDRRKILIVGREGIFSQEMMDYAIHLAERLDFDLLALSVGSQDSDEAFEMLAHKKASAFKRKADRRGIHCTHLIKRGRPGPAVEDVNREIKRVELVIADLGIDREEVAREVTIPLLSVVADSLNYEGGKNMAGNESSRGKRALAATIGYGLLSASLYGAVFMHADTIMTYFTKGGIYAALPIATVFVFSFTHGAFASNLWSLLGVEAMKKGAMHQVKSEVIQKRKRVEKKPRTYAYINPFHRIDK